VTTLFEEARQHQLRDWGARTLGLTYKCRVGDESFLATTPEGSEHLLRIDYGREEVWDLSSGRHVVICKPIAAE